MSKVVKAIWEPIETLFTAPKRLFRSGTEIGKGNWIADIATPLALGMIPGVGPGVAAGYGAWRSGQAAGGPGGPEYSLGGMLGGALKGGALGYGGAGISGGVQSMLTAGGTTGANIMGGGISTAVPAGLTGAGATGGMLASTAPANLFAAGFGGATSRALAGAGSMLGFGAGGGTTAATGGAAEGGVNLLNPMTMAGLATVGLGRLPTVPTPPNIGPIAAKWMTADAVTKAGKLAKTIETEYMGEWEPTKEIQAFIEVQGKEIEKTYKRRLESMDKNMAAINPQWYRSGERLEMIRRVEEEQTHETEMMRAQWMLTARQEWNQNRYNTVMNAMNVDDRTKQDLLYADIADVVWRYQVDRDDVLELRKLAQDAGMYAIGAGINRAMG